MKRARTGWGRQDEMGQPAQESRTQSPVLTPGVTPSAGQFPSFCTGDDALVLLPQQSAVLDLRLRPGICRFINIFDKSEVNFLSFL